MKQIIVENIPSRWGRYQMHVLEQGHLPGVLSGAELRGKARDYSDRYSFSRSVVDSWLRRYYNVRSGFALQGAPRRWQCVWVDKSKNPVKIVVKG